MQLGGALEVIHAELLPEDKARIIKDYQGIACTAMIGDGLNDAPALATANIGISMGISGSELATETSNVILLTNDIQRIPKVAHLARRVRRKVIENIILAFSIKASILALAFAGHPLVWAAVLADTGTCLLVILNSMLLLGGRSKPQKRCKKYVALLDNENSVQIEENEFSHTYQPPSCDIESQMNCDMQTCSSQDCTLSHQSGQADSSPCQSSRKYSNSSNMHNCCGQNAQIPKKNCLDCGSCYSIEHTGLNGDNYGETICSNSTKNLGDSKVDVVVRDMKYCHQGSSRTISSNVSSSFSCCAGSQLTSTSQVDMKICLSKKKKSSLIEEEAVNLVRLCCNQDACPSLGCKNEAEECGLSDNSTTNISGGNNQVGCRGISTCNASRKRQMGGCCESLRDECCI